MTPAFAAVICLGAAAGLGIAIEHAATAPATHPAPYRVADGVLLARVERADEIEPEAQFEDQADVPAPLIFAARVPDDDNDNIPAHPVIARRERDGWHVLELPAFRGLSFAGAYADGHQNLYAALDANDDPVRDVTLLKSTDGGASWRVLSRLRKPVAAASFYDLSLAADGHGVLSIYLSDKTGTHRRGFYKFATADGGVTWDKPTYQPDTLSESVAPDGDTLDEAIDAIEEDLAPEPDAPTIQKTHLTPPPATPGGDTLHAAARLRTGPLAWR